MIDLKNLAKLYGLNNWIDTLYDSDFSTKNRAFLLKIASVAAAIELAETTPLTENYQKKLCELTELAFYRGMECLNDQDDIEVVLLAFQEEPYA